MSALEPSITLELDARAKEYAQRGRDIVNMSVGEPDFPAPRAAREAAIAKVESGRVAYTQAAGTPELRSAIARHLTSTRGVAFTAAEVAVCHSAKHALSGTLLALVQEGDEVLVPLPAWGSYFGQIKVCGARPMLVPPAAGCRPDLAALARAVTPRTRAVLVNSPCNPTGYVWTAEETRALAELAGEHDLWIVSDEIYRALVYEGPPAVSPVSCGPDARARTAIIDGASKCFAMTGYRIGFVAAPVELAGAVGRLHSQLTGSPNAVSQAAYQAALETEPEELAAMRAEFAERRRVLLEGLERLGLETPEPRGAFYAFPDVSRYLDERGSVGLCEDLLETSGLSLVPGEAFGLPTHVRLSYAKPVRDVREALRRLEAFLERRR
jgi:aspartate aminotransferase